ncbi:MAG: iron dicitrate transporter FecR [Gammaproteobacteria bacterium]|nr:iron dicitrate transporter FecR [Gammaproteobacteria bacterium]
MCDSLLSRARASAVRETAHAIDAAASAWVVKVDRGLTEAEQAMLEEWLAGDSRRAGAFVRTQATWVHTDRARAFRGSHELRESPRARLWRRAMPWTSAATVLLGLATAFWAWQGHARTDNPATAMGEIRQVPLADGSRLTLDELSRVSVQYETATRRVRLEFGEVLFEVAKDPKRPFVVQAGNIRVRAVGTAFVVRRHTDGDVEVTVSEGTVDIWRETSSSEPAVRLAAGNRTLVTTKAVAVPVKLTDAQLARAVAWSVKVIDLDGRTLGDAAAEMNHYTSRTVVIADQRLAAQTVVGRFQATDPMAFAAAAAAMLDAHVRIDGDRFILEPGPSPQK